MKNLFSRISPVEWRAIALTLTAVVSLLIMVVVSPANTFLDEYDNFLGAQIMLERGGFVFTEYFTQHMPLTYILTLPLVAVFGTKLVLIRVVFAIFLWIWLVTFSRHIVRAFGWVYAAVFVLAVALAFSPTWSNMVMGETWIAWSALHALVLFCTRKAAGTNALRSMIVLAVLGCIPVLSALAYLPVSLAIYALIGWWLFERRRETSLPSIVIVAAVAAIPYVALAVVLTATGAWSDFIFQAVTFNTKYYAQFNTSSPKNAIEGVVLVFTIFFGGLWTALTDFSVGRQPQAFAVAIAALVSLGWLSYRRQWTTVIALVMFIVFSGSRGVWGDPQRGFAAAMADGSNARHAQALFFVTLFAVLLAVHQLVIVLREREGRTRVTARLGLGVAAALAVAVFIVGGSATYATAVHAKQAIAHDPGGVSVDHGPNSVSDIINTVNGPGDTYWLAPASWDKQLFIESQNASTYYFYLDHVAACTECAETVEHDLATNKPKVIYLTPNTAFGSTAIPQIRATFEDDYFTLPNPLLDGFYFRIDEKADVLSRLGAAGFDIAL